MFYADYHAHSSFSTDSNAEMEDLIKTAITLGLKQIAFTDHIDYDYPDPAFPFMIDYDHYIKVFDALKEKYKDQIEVVLGVEIGFQPHVAKQIEEVLSQYPFDFVICSTHVCDRLDLYNGDFFKDKDQKNAYLRYFECVLYNVKNFFNYDVYGHIDYINRYGNYKNKSLSYEDYKEVIDSILKTIIESGKGIEINTSGFRYGLGYAHPQLAILKRYKELGGKIITIGSDAHSSKDLASHFDEAYKLIKAAGFSEITLFKNRKPYFIKL
ncbi:MAG: histidinol-phosphatase family [Epulopiscium sp.]|jgi:histidinol-phosphatase (PHP family)|uniref:histidinol-phosphatase HisJ family protein n=1 Tax=Defluviitalea raffinosedens TaxID=1450156 RepID=UPI00176CBBBA|nr:histidinol-phosphatase HisJ family protein [Defluviitalea raffinosedens]MBM7686397.1 histidinol-phosphatase (PHP family) [Defluviitalea raffinosedens]MBZ4667810.1 hisK [Defluviitaleaceae bacterium]MDK2788441.1 histidinol-phosphatase family [Candidatus Epulonipiscium sp.]HHW67183.1 histidinol-phosphatase HisJ family protein [Candidatus Epulonipiscium sp.]